MDNPTAITALTALAQEHRLRIFQLLVRIGPAGIPAGDISKQLKIPAATLSFHLSQLASANLVVSRRESRSIIYAIQEDGISELLQFLTKDCCQGQPELCNAAFVQLDCNVKPSRKK